MLDKIVLEKKKEIARAKGRVSQETLMAKAEVFSDQTRDFKGAVSRAGKINLIAEIKKASPSAGVLREDFSLVEIARAYDLAGACALSVLTDKKFFQGDIRYLQAARREVSLPVMRKDFIIDEYQIYESVCAGADCILLIARLLSAEQLGEFYALCSQLKLQALCEVHDEEDLEKVLGADVSMIGINNRDLRAFKVDLRTTEKLIKKIPEGKVVVSESGIKTAEDVKLLRSLGVNAVLIGEAFMRSADVRVKVKELMT